MLYNKPAAGREMAPFTIHLFGSGYFNMLNCLLFNAFIYYLSYAPTDFTL